MEHINYIERRTKKIKTEDIVGKGALKWLYHSPSGKLTLHMLLKRKVISTVVGHYMSSALSNKQIKKFVHKYKVDLSLYTKESGYKNFNEFFCRKIKTLERPIGDGLVSPADGKLLAFQNISDLTTFFVKGSEFSLIEFLRNNELAQKYTYGSMIIVRLAPTDYHRFHFPANGEASETKSLKGRYFSVSPMAMKQSIKIFSQNRRVYTILKTAEYGDILMSEIGAALVGSIIQTHEPFTQVKKGSEKGYFAYGGSTVVLLFEKGKVTIDKDLLENTAEGMETEVFMGEQLGH